MPVVRRSSATSPAAAPVKKTAEPAAAALVLSLPDEPSEVSDNINDYYFMIHGVAKIGKTSMAVEEGDVLLLTFDPLNKSLPLLQRFVPTWAHLIGYLQLLEKKVAEGTYRYKRCVLDGTDLMYRLCQRAVEKELVVDHVSEEKWGRGWDKLKDTFIQTVDRLMALPGGCWFICHSEWREIETRRGVKATKLMPLMKAAAEEIVVGKCDCWCAYDYNGKERVLIVRGHEKIGAGTKVKNHFMTTDGRPVYEIPMGDSETDAWANLVAAFNNEQRFASLAERDGDPVVEDQKGGSEAESPDGVEEVLEVLEA